MKMGMISFKEPSKMHSDRVSMLIICKSLRPSILNIKDRNRVFKNSFYHSIRKIILWPISPVHMCVCV